MLYEERFSVRWIFLLLIPAFVALGVGLYFAYQEGQGLWGVGTGLIITLLLAFEVSNFRLTIDERAVKIRGGLGLIRITVPIDEIKSFYVAHDWKACSGFVHFNLPAKGCVLIRKRNGKTVSFSTNNPEEVARVLVTLGVPRAP
ncbi:hypothetical protein A3L14_09045 [Thermococcus thioreducens]|uniref:PH domain-containing protein n=1 Tax=Thermococcus thioreducens TaxID=277988 RepID=A0A1I0M186_9EURY|nr:hypothetical protein A3L14_09045 [Thermococcus thioreducens]SEV82205.1 hypothetical protein SAMN05216170_0130 [Thermococcus thioreducens]